MGCTKCVFCFFFWPKVLVVLGKEHIPNYRKHPLLYIKRVFRIIILALTSFHSNFCNCFFNIARFPPPKKALWNCVWKRNVLYKIHNRTVNIIILQNKKGQSYTFEFPTAINFIQNREFKTVVVFINLKNSTTKKMYKHWLYSQQYSPPPFRSVRGWPLLPSYVG